MKYVLLDSEHIHIVKFLRVSGEDPAAPAVSTVPQVSAASLAHMPIELPTWVRRRRAQSML